MHISDDDEGDDDDEADGDGDRDNDSEMSHGSSEQQLEGGNANGSAGEVQEKTA